jgi:hypothetical protein
MNRLPGSRTRLATVIGTVAIVGLVATGCSSSSSSSTTTTSSTSASALAAQVIGAAYANSIGFPKTVQAPKSEKVTSQKGCTDSVEAVYEDAAGKTGLISDVLNCSSEASAAAALVAARKHVTTDPSIAVPKALGSSAFATSSNAPEYLIVWQPHDRVGITALDVDTTATSATSAAASPLSAAQAQTLDNAAAHQNSLYSS